MNWAYVAGFFDGEGCLHAVGSGGQGKGRFRITIAQTNEEVLEEIAEFLQHHGIAAYVLEQSPKRSQREHWKMCWNVWITKQSSVVRFIDHVLPYLRVKKQRAEDYRRTCIMVPQLQGMHPVVYSDGHIRVVDPTSEQRAVMTPVNGYAKVNRAKFIEAMRSGVSIADAARAFGLDYSTAYDKAKRLGFHIDSIEDSNRKRAKHTLEQIVEAIALVGGVREAAAHLDLPLSNLRVRLQKAGIDPGPSSPIGRPEGSKNKAVRV
jgi:hypothetical protein